MLEKVEIIGSTDNDGSYQWPIIPPAIHSAVKVRVSSTTDPPIGADEGASARSDPAFKIKGKLEVTYPSGAGTWNVADPKTLEWNTTGPIETVEVRYSIDDGFSYPGAYVISDTCDAGIGSGDCPWTVDDHFTDKFLVKLTDVSSYTGDPDLVATAESLVYPNSIAIRPKMPGGMAAKPW